MKSLRSAMVVLFLGVLGTTAFCRPPAISAMPKQARWIWYPEGTPNKSAPAGTRYFRRVIEIPPKRKIRTARFYATIDDNGLFYLNGNSFGKTTSGWNQFDTFDIKKHLKPGINILSIECHNGAGAAGLFAFVAVHFAKGKPLVIATDSSWKASTKQKDATWKDSKILGPLTTAPWGTRMSVPGGLGPEIVRTDDQGVTAEKAKELIELDWLFQASGNPTPERSLQEIDWARKKAEALASGHETLDFSKELAELTELEQKLKAEDLEDEAGRELYIAVRRVKRRIMFRNPLMNFDRILLADSPNYSGVHESAHRNGYQYRGRSGGRMVILDGIGPDAKETVLVPPEAGFLMRMDLSFDAKKIVFGMQPKEGVSFHLYEIGVDGSNLRQLTNSPYDDMDPIYLPDGHIMFSTSRGNTYVRCLPPSASTILARCDGDGKNIRIISRNNEPDYTPCLLPDGRVLYTRWEYTERPLWRLQKLWTINPDGTGLSVYWGNASAHPDMIWEARPIPGTTKVIFAGVGHHNVVTGCIGIIDVTRGLEYPNGITKVTADLRWPESGDAPGENPVASPDYHAGGSFWSYRCPFPLGEEDFLVSAARKTNRRFDLYLMDIHGNRELLYVGMHNTWYARPMRPRRKPLHRPDRVAWPRAGEKPAGGVLFSSNVYEGVEGLSNGTAKYLRVIQMDAKTYSFGYKSWRHSGPAISVIQEDGVKRILGEVPIEADGSVSFKVPSGKALHFQLLDKDRRCIQIMRSFTGVMPGESRGCLGCHGMHHATGQTLKQRKVVNRPPAELTPPPWGADVSISYERFCQPVIDKYCGKCHQGDGKGRKKLDLTLRGGVAERGIKDPKLLPFKEPYLTLVGQAWGAPAPASKGKGMGLAGCMNVERHRTYGPLKPMSMLSSASPLIKMVMSGTHNKVKIEGVDLLKLIAWVDCNCVYRGDEEVRQIPDPAPSNRWPVPMLTKTAPRIERLVPVTDPPGK